MTNTAHEHARNCPQRIINALRTDLAHYKAAHGRLIADRDACREMLKQVQKDNRQLGEMIDERNRLLIEAEKEKEKTNKPVRVVVYQNENEFCVDNDGPAEVLMIDTSIPSDKTFARKLHDHSNKITSALVPAMVTLSVSKPNPQVVADRFDTFMQTKGAVA